MLANNAKLQKVSSVFILLREIFEHDYHLIVLTITIL